MTARWASSRCWSGPRDRHGHGRANLVFWRLRALDAWTAPAASALDPAHEAALPQVAGRAFALFAAVASFGIGNMIQANSMALPLTTTCTSRAAWRAWSRGAGGPGDHRRHQAHRTLHGQAHAADDGDLRPGRAGDPDQERRRGARRLPLIFAHAFTPDGRGRRLRGQRRGLRHPARRGPRRLQQRVGPGQRAHRPRGGQDQGARARGPGGHDRPLRGHAAHLHHDGAGDPHHRGLDPDRPGHGRAATTAPCSASRPSRWACRASAAGS